MPQFAPLQDIKAAILQQMASAIRRSQRLGFVEIALLIGAVVFLATAIRLLFGLIFSLSLVYATYYPAILILALFAGARAALVGIGLSVIAAWWSILPPLFEFGVLTRTDIANIGLFVVVSLILAGGIAVCRELFLTLEDHERQKTLLLREAQHRGRNLLTVLHLLARNSIRHESDRACLLGRLQAIARTQDLIDNLGNDIDIRLLFEAELSAIFDDAASVADINGPPFTVSGIAAKSLRLLIHELTTNALRHGALSAAGGRLIIGWQVGDKIVMRWAETNGPRVAAPKMSGFGSHLMQRSLDALSAQSIPDYDERGYRYTLTFDPVQLQPPAVDVLLSRQ